MPTRALSLSPTGQIPDSLLFCYIHIYVFNSKDVFFPLFVCLSLAGHLCLSDSKQKLSETTGRNESNVYLNTFYQLDKDANFDIISVESSDSLETSVSAFCPNIRCDSLSGKATPMDLQIQYRLAGCKCI